jgi:hypothetical protein
MSALRAEGTIRMSTASVTVLSDPMTNPAILAENAKKLSGRNDAASLEALRAIASNPNTPLATIGELAQYVPLAASIAVNPALPLYKLQGDLPNEVLIALADHAPTDADAMRVAMDTYGDSLVYALALALRADTTETQRAALTERYPTLAHATPVAG